MVVAKSKKILGFNGVRGVCVIAVYLSHKCELRFYLAAMGVWTFFALSGFLIIGELHKARLAVENGDYGAAKALRTFASKRALRIFPAYYALLALLFLGRGLYAWAGPDLGFGWHVAYLSNVYFGWIAPGTGGPFPVLWTLSAEQQFYVFAAFAFIFCPARWHVAMCLSAAVAAAVGHVVMQASGAGVLAVYMTSPWNFAIVMLGGAAGIVMRDEAWHARLQGRWPLLAFSTVAAAFAASWLLYPTQDPEGSVSIFAVSFALVGIIAWIRANQDSRLVQALEWRPIEYLGVISYGFYLVHNFVPNPLGKILPLYLGITAPPLVTMTLGAAIGFVVSVTIAHLSWRYYESWILRRWRPKKAGEPNVHARTELSADRGEQVIVAPHADVSPQYRDRRA